MATRKYEQRLRAQSADETRRRILDALSERVRAAPSQPVSVDEVARAAGVARSTVYLIFGSRLGLFDALGEDLLLRRGAYDRLLEAVALPDARDTLRGGIRAGAEMFAEDRDIARALYSMARFDSDALGETIRRSETERTGGMRRLARRLAEQGALRPDVTAEDAAHVLWVLTSFDSFDLLYNDRGLSLDDVVGLLVAMAERTLLADP